MFWKDIPVRKHHVQLRCNFQIDRFNKIIHNIIFRNISTMKSYFFWLPRWSDILLGPKNVNVWRSMTVMTIYLVQDFTETSEHVFFQVFPLRFLKLVHYCVDLTPHPGCHPGKWRFRLGSRPKKVMSSWWWLASWVGGRSKGLPKDCQILWKSA